jgi:hypothetical protein
MRKIIWIIKNLSMFTIWNEIIFNFFTFEDVEYQQTPSYSVDDTTNCQPFPSWEWCCTPIVNLF